MQLYQILSETLRPPESQKSSSYLQYFLVVLSVQTKARTLRNAEADLLALSINLEGLNFTRCLKSRILRRFRSQYHLED